MNRSGGAEELYVAARRVLLDALLALAPHRNAIVLVGAQAVYLHTGDTGLRTTAYTTDGDLAIDPVDLAAEPLLKDTMEEAGFTQGEQPGQWRRHDVEIDLMVPAQLGGGGRRGARLGAHGTSVARKARGLEGAMVDREQWRIGALDPNDERSIEAWVAGPGALVTAKVLKIAERLDEPDRRRDKDALDVLRLLRATSTDRLSNRFRRLLRSDLARPVTHEAVRLLPELFGSLDAPGVSMAARATSDDEDQMTVRNSLVILTLDLLAALGEAPPPAPPPVALAAVRSYRRRGPRHDRRRGRDLSR